MDESAYHGYGCAQEGHQRPYRYQHKYYQQPEHPDGPYHQAYVPPPHGQPAYYGQQPQGAQINAYPPPAAPSGGEHGLQAHDAVKGLGKKFKGLMGRSRRASCSSRSSSSSSSSSSGSSSDSDASSSKKNKKKNNNKKKDKKPTFATQPHSDPRHGPHPFSIFCPASDGAHITLTLAGTGTQAALLLGPRHDASRPAFRIEHHDDDGGGFRCWRHDLPDLDPSRPVLAGSAARGRREGGRCAFAFPWGASWDLDVDGLAAVAAGAGAGAGAVDEVWQSDVGLCGGRSWMRWCVLLGTDEEGEGDGRFVARCVDVTRRGMPTVASFEVVGVDRDGDHSHDQDGGRLEIVAGLVRTVEQLDELVVVSYAVMNGIREGLQRRDE